MKNINVLEDVLIVAGVSVSLAQIQTILGIIILSFQIILIIYKGVRRIIDHAKEKDFDAIEDDIKKTTEDLEKLKESSKNIKDGK